MLTKWSALQQTLLLQSYCNIHLLYYKGLCIAPHHLNDYREYRTMQTRLIHRIQTSGYLGFHTYIPYSEVELLT